MKKSILIGMLTLIGIPIFSSTSIDVRASKRALELEKDLQLIENTIKWCNNESITRDMNVRKYKLLKNFECTP